MLSCSEVFVLKGFKMNCFRNVTNRLPDSNSLHFFEPTRSSTPVSDEGHNVEKVVEPVSNVHAEFKEPENKKGPNTEVPMEGRVGVAEAIVVK